MAKRRGRSVPKARDVFEWSTKEVAALLVYIDHCCETGKPRGFIQDTIADHLKSKWSRDYTWRRVENRLKIIHRRAHKLEYKSRGHIVSKGTACLDLENLDTYFLPHELTLDDIRIAKAELKVQLSSNNKLEVEITAIRLSTRLSANPGYLKSRRFVTRSPVIRGHSQETRTARATSTRSPDSSQQSLSILAKRKRAAGSNFTSKKTLRPDLIHQIRAIESTEIPDSDNADQNGSISTDTSDTCRKVSPVQKENSLSFETSRAYTSANREETDLEDRNIGDSADHQGSETTVTMMSQQVIIDDLHAINFTLKNQLAASEKRFQDLLTIWDRKANQKYDERALLDSRRQLSKAAEENAILKTILKFKRAKDPGVVLTDSETEKELGYITNRLKMTFEFNRTVDFEIPNHINPNSETEYLLFMAVSRVEASNADVQLSLRAVKDFKPLNLLRAMMSSALDNWIFENNWPRFDRRSCIKLQGYRELIFLLEASLGEGVKYTQDLDFAVDQLLMRKAAFNDDLAERASELSDRLVKALTPFFVSDLSQKSLLDHLSIEIAEIKDFVGRALKLKLDLLNSPYSYSFVTFQSGNTFDPSTMRIETENGSPVAKPAKYPAIVELCLSPALFRSSDRRGASDEGQLQSIELGEAGFIHNNFVKKISGAREIVTKAVVLLQNKAAHSK